VTHTIEEVREFKSKMDQDARRRATGTLRRIGLSWRDVVDIRRSFIRTQSPIKKPTQFRWAPKS
jgi:hypothetical protein